MDGLFIWIAALLLVVVVVVSGLVLLVGGRGNRKQHHRKTKVIHGKPGAQGPQGLQGNVGPQGTNIGAALVPDEVLFGGTPPGTIGQDPGLVWTESSGAGNHRLGVNVSTPSVASLEVAAQGTDILSALFTGQPISSPDSLTSERFGQLSSAPNGGTAFGNNASAIGDSATAVGRNSQATGQQAVAVGDGANATNFATAVGASAGATALNSTAVGFNAQASAKSATALGSNAVASNTGSIALGASAVTSTNNELFVNLGGQTLQTNLVVAASGVIPSTHTLQIMINNVTYKLLMTT